MLDSGGSKRFSIKGWVVGLNILWVFFLGIASDLEILKKECIWKIEPSSWINDANCPSVHTKKVLMPLFLHTTVQAWVIDSGRWEHVWKYWEFLSNFLSDLIITKSSFGWSGLSAKVELEKKRAESEEFLTAEASSFYPKGFISVSSSPHF